MDQSSVDDDLVVVAEGAIKEMSSRPFSYLSARISNAAAALRLSKSHIFNESVTLANNVHERYLRDFVLKK